MFIRVDFCYFPIAKTKLKKYIFAGLKLWDPATDEAQSTITVNRKQIYPEHNQFC